MANTAKINTVITNDNSQFKKSINDCNKQVEGFSKGSLSKIGNMIGGAFALGAVAEWGKQQLENADALVTLSDSIGMTTDSLQALYSTGRHSNIGTEDIDKGLSKLANAQDEVINGNQATIETFKKLGVSAEEVASSDLETLFQKVANGAQQSATAINDVNDIFGKGMGIKMKPLLQEVADEGFGGITEKAKEAGEVIDAIDLKQMANMSDELEHGFKRASDFLIKGVMKVLGLVKDISAMIGAWAGGAGFVESLQMLAKGEIGTGADRKKAEEDVKKEQAQKELERIQKTEQQKNNIRLKEEEKYQKELTDMLKKGDEERLKNQEKAIDKLAKKKEALAKIEEKNSETNQELNDKYSELDKGLATDKKNVKESFQFNVANSMQSQGAGLGNSISASYSVQEQQLKVQEKIAELTRKHTEAIDKVTEWAKKQYTKIDELKQSVEGT